MVDTSVQKERLAQRKAKLSLDEQKLKLEERKIRTRRLIELGGLVVKAALDHLNNNTLLGALLFLKRESHQKENIDLWTEHGAQSFEESKHKTNKEEKIPLIITFKSEPTRETKSQLRDLKFKWNPFRKEWYGYGIESEILDAVKDIGGSVEGC